MTVYILTTNSQREARIPTFSRSYSRVTEIQKVLVYSQRNKHSGLERMLKVVITSIEGCYEHTDAAPMCVSDLGKGRIIHACLILTFLLRHPSLVVGRNKKLGYRDSKYSHLFVLR